MQTIKVSLIVFILSINIYAQWEWENIGLAGPYIYDIEIDNSNNIYVAAGGLYKSSDNGISWEFKNIGAVGIEIDQNGIIYIVGFTYVFKSTDGGNTFFQIAQSIQAEEFYEIKIISDGTLFLSTFRGIYKSYDEGISWFPTGFTGFGAMDIGMNTNGTMFFVNGSLSWMGLYRSSDLGNTWQVNYPFYLWTALEYLNDGSVLAGCTGVGTNNGGLYVSTDDGNSWENTNSFNDNDLSFQDIKLDKNQDLYVSLRSYNPNQRGIFLSTDNGYYWIYVGLKNIFETTCLAIDSMGYIYAGSSYEGIFRTPGRTTIPVELFSFTASVLENKVELNWSTATETNNSGFEILKKKSGDRSQESEWENIGFVPGHGTTIETQHYSFTDNHVNPGKYQYRLKQIDFDGTFEYSKTIEVEVNSPTKFYLEQNYPNPFNPSTKIKYSIPSVTLRQAQSDNWVTLKVYDVLGNEVATLVNEYKPAGTYEVNFNSNSDEGQNLSSGIYFYQLKAGDFVQSKKMMYLK
ncbi:MAG: T9SS type A sorting domain-containing protein [Ignavibacteriaceae bacterium]|jgi:hypothetical protein|nr:T9SS type A sorting domain-containing protein [Ignavibacteriaceae bacterium]